jgi:hypothetical protein
MLLMLTEDNFSRLELYLLDSVPTAVPMGLWL